MSYDRNQALDAMQVNAPRSGAYLFTVLSGESWNVWADNAEAAVTKLRAYFDTATCPDCQTDNCNCVDTNEVLTEVIDTDQEVDDHTHRIMEALNADSLISLLPIYYRIRLKEIIEGTTHAK